MKKIAIIPARSGSKGLVHKNILNLYGKPLIAWTIEAALKCKEFEKVIFSTDSQQYGEIARQYGAEVIYRNDNVSNDQSTTYDVIKDLFLKINKSEFDYFVLLQPTSPFRNERHIKEAVSLFEKNFDAFDTLVSMKKAHKSSALIKPIENDSCLKFFDKDFSTYRRQDYKEYEPNGAIFISKINQYLNKGHFFGKKGIAYIMNEEDSIDIDNRNDFELAINLLIRKNKKIETENLVKNRVVEKNLLNIQVKHPMTLIGHSFFDRWKTDNILGMLLNNLAINGCTAELYQTELLSKRNFDYIGDYVLIMFGTNEILFEKNIDVIIIQINELIKKIRTYKPKKIFFVNITNVNGRIDRDNNFINKCEKYFSDNIQADKIINMKELNNQYGWLDENYTNDGLHLNSEGYEKFKEILEREIRNDL